MVEKGEGSYDRDNRNSKRHANNQYGNNNYEYFEKLPDELVILIFTKLSSSNAIESDDDIKLLARCSILSKRFCELVCQVPTLTINCPSIILLYEFGPKILKKFKHITLLKVKHWSFAETRMNNAAMDIPTIMWEATYRPHSYCLSVVSYKLAFYSTQQHKHTLMKENADNDHMFTQANIHTQELMCLHHMLVSSIKDLVNLQRVVVTDLENRGKLILEADDLVELRNCSSTNLEQVQVRWRSASYSDYDFPLNIGAAGFVLRNLRFHVIEWCENDQINVYDDDDGGIPSALAFRGYRNTKFHKDLLERLLANPHDINPNQAIIKILSFLKSEGSLL